MIIIKIMKAAFTLACVVATINAQTVITTSNECWKGQGGSYRGSCSDVYFFTCDEYEVETSCNVLTFSDSRLTWFASSVNVAYWSYYLAQNADSENEITGADFDNGNCYEYDPVPTAYENGLVMNYTGGMCGFKYQVTNNNENGFPQQFKVMKDNAATLLAGSAMAMAAILSF